MSPRHPLRAVFLGSGSSGNATAITDGVTTILIDCGFSAREVARRMERSALSAADVAAILLTHEHTDHVRGVDVFARRHAPNCRVLASAGTRREAPIGGQSDVEVVTCSEPVAIGTLTVTPFRTSHDAAEPLGFRVDAEDGSVGIVSDTGVLTPEAAEVLRGVTVLGLESNHDLGMLERGPYPPFLKRRIRSERGHLSNVDAVAALGVLASDDLTHVFALHRSRTNNTADLVTASLGSGVERLGLEITVTVAAQQEPCDSCPPQGALFPANG